MFQILQFWHLQGPTNMQQMLGNGRYVLHRAVATLYQFGPTTNYIFPLSGLASHTTDCPKVAHLR
jgi:hypothetical protein